MSQVPEQHTTMLSRRWWVRLCNWLWARWGFVWGTLIVGIFIGVASTWLTTQPKNIEGTPIGMAMLWVHRNLLLASIIGAILLVFTLLVGLVNQQADASTPPATTPSELLQKRSEALHYLDHEYRRQLTQSLQGVATIQLSLQSRMDVLHSPARLISWRMNETDLRPFTYKSIVEAYDEASAGLLVLGAPGAGKSTLLRELAHELLARAEQNATLPIPVIVNLSSWAINRPPLTDWLVDQLHLVYAIPRHLSRFWIEQDLLLVLLDGLDEVAASARTACIETINTYHSEHFVPLVICTRSHAYLTQGNQLRLPLAVELQPLTYTEVDVYLKGIGKPLAALRAALRGNPVLRDLVNTPLLLSVMMLTYRGKMAKDLTQLGSPENQQQQVFERYVAQVLEQPARAWSYAPQLTRKWLSWLAKQMQQRDLTEFHFENLQPSWLPTKQGQALSRWLIWLVGALVGALVGGLLFGLVSSSRLLFRVQLGNESHFGPVAAVLISSLLFGLLFGLLSCGLIFGSVGGLAIGLLFGLLFGLLTGVPTTGLVFGLFLGLIGMLAGEANRGRGAKSGEFSLAQVLAWLWKRFWRGLIGGKTLREPILGVVLGVVLGVILEVILEVVFRLVFRLVFGLREPLYYYSLEEFSLVGRLILALVGGLLVGLPFGLLNGLIGSQAGEANRGQGAKNTDLSLAEGTWSWKRFWRGMIGGLGFALFVGFAIDFLYSQFAYLLPGLVAGLVIGLLVGLFNRMIGEANSRRGTERGEIFLPEVLTWSWKRFWRGLIGGGLVGGLGLLLGLFGIEIYYFYFNFSDMLVLGLAFGLLVGIPFGLLNGLVGEENSKRRVEGEANFLPEVLTWSWKRFLQGVGALVLFCVLVGLLSAGPIGMPEGLVTGLVLSLIVGPFVGLSSISLNEHLRTKPNQGIYNSGWNAIRIGLPVGLVFGLLFGLFSSLAGNLFFGLFFGLLNMLFFGLFFGLLFGGRTYFAHYSLRFLLWRNGKIPWHTVRFLNEATEHALLQSLGGGYRFIHPLFQEYFASLNSAAPPTAVQGLVDIDSYEP